MEKKQKGTAITAAPKQQPKGTDSPTQYKVVFHKLMENPQTMLEVSMLTGILRANICRYIASMVNAGVAQMIYKDKDRYTHSLAGHYTTDKALFKKLDGLQLDLFGEGVNDGL
jgi:response regulator of citrate/malate metabolism